MRIWSNKWDIRNELCLSGDNYMYTPAILFTPQTARWSKGGAQHSSSSPVFAFLTTYEPSRSLRSSNKRLLSVFKTNTKSLGWRFLKGQSLNVWSSTPTHIHSSLFLNKTNKTRLFRKAFSVWTLSQTFCCFVSRIVIVPKFEGSVYTSVSVVMFVVHAF